LGRLYLGIVAYERNNLAEAVEHFTSAFNRRLSTTAVIGVDSICGLALTYLALGDHERAAAWAATLLTAVSESQNGYYQALANWFACRLALQRGTSATPPLSYLHVVGSMPSIQMRWSELPDLTYARVLIAQGGKANLADALALLNSLLDRARRHRFTWREVEVQAVRALALQAQGQQAAALEVLAEAVRVAQSYGLVRTFVDLGPKLAALLHLLARDGVAADYVGRLLAAFPLAARNAVAVAAAEREDEEIIEPLSERELEVLALLAERLTDKEIAERLRISPLTVRRHSVNLYQKLHVNSRRQAVIRAQALGLLRVSA
jgi:LuxR family maltose regulon positive regulatory protein